jgi:predicted N-acyltransferase
LHSKKGRFSGSRRNYLLRRRIGAEMKPYRYRAPPASVEPDAQRIAVVGRSALSQSEHWRHAFAHERKDHRFYEIIEDTIMPEFQYRYFVLRDNSGVICAVQPFFLLDQDLLEGSSHALRGIANAVRRIWPRFLVARTLMLGCAAGEAHLDRNDSGGQLDAQLIAREITERAREMGAALIVLKEFPSGYRPRLDCFLDHGFARIPSLPMAELSLNYVNFEDYLRKGVSSRTRSELRRKFRKADAGAPITMSVVRDISGLIDQIYPLYLQVYERSDRHFELLSKDFFCELGRRMPEKVRFFIWRSEGRIIAFSLTLVHDDHICNEYLGLDYDFALDRHLYFVAFRDVISWAIANGYKRCLSTGLSYAPKLKLGFKLFPLDLYVRHTSDIVNFLLKLTLPFIEPTRSETTLRRFDNYESVHERSRRTDMSEVQV